MIRRKKPGTSTAIVALSVQKLRSELISRRRFLIQAAGGSVALLFGLPHTVGADDYDPWPTLGAVLEHLLPTEADSPGAKEVHAIDYFRFVVADDRVDREQRDFILQGNRWLDDLAREKDGRPFIELDFDGKERLLRQVTRSSAGENWVSTLLTYLFEALLTAPAYGGNIDGVGWRWLQYVPGFPLPAPGTRYMELPL
jgi:gluconate 2-dehydrogenase gamma chain